MVPDMSKAINDKLHINITPVNSNKHSDMLSGMRPLNEQEIAYMQASVERIYGKFTELVANGINKTVEEVDEIAQGRVWTGAEALEIGLVDKIGTLEDALNYAVLSVDGAESLQDVQIVEYPKPQTTLEILLEELTGEETVFAGTPLENIGAAFQRVTSAQTGKAYARIPYEIVLN
jgi:protease-4